MHGFASPRAGHAPWSSSASVALARRRRARTIAPLLLLALTLGACASRAHAPVGGALGMQLTARPALFYAGHAEEINAGESLLDFLRRRDPAALRARDLTNLAALDVSPFDPAIGVYIDGAFMGGLEVLPTIVATDVIAVRRLHAAELSASMARHHSEGIIDIRLRH